MIPDFRQFAASARMQFAPTPACLLREIAFRGDPSGWAYRSQDDLAADIRVSKSTIIRWQAKLIADGRLEKCPAVRAPDRRGSVITLRPCGYRPIHSAERDAIQAARIAAEAAAEAALAAEEIEHPLYCQDDNIRTEERDSLPCLIQTPIPAEERKIAMREEGDERGPPGYRLGSSEMRASLGTASAAQQARVLAKFAQEKAERQAHYDRAASTSKERRDVELEVKRQLALPRGTGTRPLFKVIDRLMAPPPPPPWANK